MINKQKILAGVQACVNPIGALCKNCPYWNNGNKQCEELRRDIYEAVHVALNSFEDWSGLQGGL